MADRRRGLVEAFTALANEEGFDAMSAALALNVPGERHLAVSTVMTHLAPTDPRAALTAAQSFVGGLRDDLVRTAIQAMVLENPVAALTACEALPDAAKTCLPSAYRQWTMIAPEAAIANVIMTRSGQELDQTLYTVFRTWSHTDPDGALRWLQGTGNTALESQRRLTMATSLIHEDPSYFTLLEDSFSAHAVAQLQQARIGAIADMDFEPALVEADRLRD
ncbi:MAG: hypothetical protein AAFU65_11590, partial [Pseudomonadota bacterium]